MPEHTEQPTHSSTAYSSALIVAIGQPLSFAILFLVNVLLARSLAPDAVGLVTMVTAVTNFVFIFRDLGLGTITQQATTLSKQQSSNLFWLNVIAGAVLTLVVLFLAWPLSLLYGDSRIVSITTALASIFLLSGVGIQHAALLRRELRFGMIVSAEIVSLSISGLVAVWYATQTHSYWSLVLFTVSRQFLTTLAFLLVKRWRPNSFRRGHGTRALAIRGAHVAGFDLINYWSRNFDNIVVGRTLGADVLGIYKKAYELLLLPISQIRAPLMAVSLPTLSRIRTSPEVLGRTFLDITSAVALLCSTVIASLLLVISWAVPAILGPQWAATVPVFQALAPAAVIQSVVGLLGLLLVTTDQTSRYFRWGVMHASLMILSFVVGIRWGLSGLIVAYVSANALAFIPSVWYCTTNTKVLPRDFLKAALFPNAFCWLSFLVALVAQQLMLSRGFEAGISMALSVVALVAGIGMHLSISRVRYRLLFTLVQTARKFLRNPSVRSRQQSSHVRY